MPKFFDTEKSFEKMLQMTSFQQSQQRLCFKEAQSLVRLLNILVFLDRLFHSFCPQKDKNKKAMQAKTTLEAEIVQLRAQAKKMEEQRKRMQSKLAQIHQRNQQKTTLSSTLSSSTFAQSVSSNAKRSKSFFHDKGPMFSRHTSSKMMNDSNLKSNP